MTRIRSRDAGRIQDRRGSGGGGGGLGGGLPGGLGKAAAGGGGVVGLLIVLAVTFLPGLLGGEGGGAAGGLGGSSGAVPAGGEADGSTCESELEQIVCGATNDVSEYWIEQLPASFDVDYVDTNTVFFSGATTTGCGPASSQTGPFYCPADGLVYFDLDFLVQLQERFDATGDLAAQYIVAHEFGHHVQNVLGISDEVRRAQASDQGRANQYSVALELQADCFAGAWARSASDRGLFDSPGELDEALDAAAAVGDDSIQQTTQGRSDPETFTHGTSAQRVQWFRRGFDTGDPERCTTFAEVL